MLCLLEFEQNIKAAEGKGKGGLVSRFGVWVAFGPHKSSASGHEDHGVGEGGGDQGQDHRVLLRVVLL